MYALHLGENLDIILAAWQTDNKRNALILEIYRIKEAT